MKKSILKLGKETYGTKNVDQVFQEAFAPYFAFDEKASRVQALHYWNQLKRGIKHKARKSQ